MNEDSTPTSEFIKSRDWYAPITDLIDRLRGRVRQGQLVSTSGSHCHTTLR